MRKSRLTEVGGHSLREFALAIWADLWIVRSMKPIRGSLVAWEMVLLYASILVFRSAWTLLDRWAWAGQTTGLITLLLLGSAVSVVAFRAINKS